MKKIERAYKISEKAVSFLTSSKVRHRAVIAIVALQLFTIVSVFAASGSDEWCWEVGPAYEGAREVETSGGKDPDQADVSRDMNNRIVAFTDGIIGTAVGPDLGCSAEVASERYGKSYGLIGSVDNLTRDALSNPPSVNVVAHLADEWVPGYNTTDTSVYADGYDYLQSLNITDLSERTRFLSYIFFVLILIAAGFMVMFRQKIGGQMMVTIFNTLPKVVIGLILVTFSFSIVGLILDLGVVLMTISGAVLGLSGDGVAVTNPFSLLSVLVTGSDGIGFISSEVGVAGIVATILGFFTGPGALISILVSFLAIAVIAIVFYASVKVYITLLKAYLGIILDTILAPIFLTFAVLPGKGNIGFSWFYRVLKNVMTFVGVYFIVNLAMILFESDVSLAFPSGLTTGSLTPSPGFSAMNAILKGILPLALFFIAAEVPNFLGDIFPADGGRGAGTALQNVQKSFGKIPIVGSFFG